VFTFTREIYQKKRRADVSSGALTLVGRFNFSPMLTKLSFKSPYEKNNQKEKKRISVTQRSEND